MSENLREEESYKRKLEGKNYKNYNNNYNNYNRRYYEKNLQDKKPIA